MYEYNAYMCISGISKYMKVVVHEKNVLLRDHIITFPMLFSGQALLYIKVEIKEDVF